MQMTKGNKAIRDHSEDGKIIYIFEYARRAYVRYIGTGECINYDVETRFDRNDDPREVFIFNLIVNSTPEIYEVAETSSVYVPIKIKKIRNMNTKELRDIAISREPVNATISVKKQITHYRSEAIKNYALG